MGEMRVTLMCPKCGDILFPLEEAIESSDEYCDVCGTQRINVNEDVDEDEIDDLDDRDLVEQHMYEKYLFNNPLFDKEVYEKRVKELNDFMEGVRERAAADREERDHPRCPRCGSTAISANQKGFSPGKAVVGGLIWGEAGLLRGFVGSGQVEITCLNCGYKWKPGQS